MDGIIFFFILLSIIYYMHASIISVPENIEGDWELKFQDNFSQNLDHWNRLRHEPPNSNLRPRRFSRIAPGLSYYLPENAFIKNNKLNLQVIKQQYDDGRRTYQNTGAKVELKYPFTYGYINVRAKLPRVKKGGVYHIGLKGKHGIITIMEAINDMNFYSHTTKLRGKFKEYNWLFQATNGFTSKNFYDYKTDDFNDFGVHWGFQNVTFYINTGLACFQVVSKTQYTRLENKVGPYPVDEPMTLAIWNGCGNWGGFPDYRTDFPYTMEIESVHVFQDKKFDRSDFNGDKEKKRKEEEEKKKEDERKRKEEERKEKEDKRNKREKKRKKREEEKRKKRKEKRKEREEERKKRDEERNKKEGEKRKKKEAENREKDKKREEKRKKREEERQKKELEDRNKKEEERKKREEERQKKE